jgi:glutathione-regulated potassium-efflux system ancillary protein KefC
MSTGLTSGSISTLFGLTHHIITQQQYSYLIAAVIGSAIVPTLIANAFFLPHHLIRPAEPEAFRSEPARIGKPGQGPVGYSSDQRG